MNQTKPNHLCYSVNVLSLVNALPSNPSATPIEDDRSIRSCNHGMQPLYIIYNVRGNVRLQTALTLLKPVSNVICYVQLSMYGNFSCGNCWLRVIAAILNGSINIAPTRRLLYCVRMVLACSSWVVQSHVLSRWRPWRGQCM